MPTATGRRLSTPFTHVVRFPHRPAFPFLTSPRAYRIFTEGILLLGHYTSSFSSVLSCNSYDNHPGAQDNLDAIETKFATEEDKSNKN
jgi:hypothetical protein